jgi:hypothetical protein
MEPREVKIWYDREADFLEVLFDNRAGFYRETSSDHVMEKVDDEGRVLGFSVQKVRALSNHPLSVLLPAVVRAA